MVFISFKAGVFFLRQRLERVSVVVLVSYDDASKKKKKKNAQVQHVCVQENTHFVIFTVSRTVYVFKYDKYPSASQMTTPSPNIGDRTLSQNILDPFKRMPMCCQDRYSVTRARWRSSVGYQNSGVWNFWARYCIMAMLQRKNTDRGKLQDTKPRGWNYLNYYLYHLSARQKSPSLIAGTFLMGVIFLNSSPKCSPGDRSHTWVRQQPV